MAHYCRYSKKITSQTIHLSITLAKGKEVWHDEEAI